MSLRWDNVDAGEGQQTDRDDLALERLENDEQDRWWELDERDRLEAHE
jgi:hypothetical protein